MTGMSSPVVPAKTPLGQQELRQRRHALGQRHRTVLFLVDGRRTLSEVLALAHQAGAQTSHFEELVRLGLIELPVEEVVDEAPTTASGALDAPAVTSVELPFDDALVDGRKAVASPAAAVAAAPTPPSGAAAPLPAEMLLPVDRPPQRTRAVPRRAVALDDDVAPASLDEVRQLLVDTLRLDSPMFAARMLMRVRGAQSARELIDLVWELESRLGPARRSRIETASLQRARDLLGLGNTLVAEDSRLEATEPG